jgi:hypothetical protein
MGDKVIECPWEEIDKFHSFQEYEKFKDWISEQVALKNADEVPVRERYSGTMMREELWFKHLSSDQIWRLVGPDPPFYGVFEPITKID